MPELPEVETVARDLAGRIIGKTIRDVKLRRADLRQPFPKNLKVLLIGRKIVSVGRRAKYVLIHLDDASVLVLHLGMSGSITVRQAKNYQPQKHDHVLIALDGGNLMVMNDPRRFGLLTVVKSDELKNHKLFRALGMEPLSNKFTGKALHTLLKNKNTNVKAAIMDQSLVVGVGNIYAAESLYLAGILPTRNSRKITIQEAEKLTKSIKNVLCAAIEAGGSTISDYRSATGKSGKFQVKFQVYGRAGEKCLRCGSLVKSIRQNGRSTFYCAVCQS